VAEQWAKYAGVEPMFLEVTMPPEPQPEPRSPDSIRAEVRVLVEQGLAATDPQKQLQYFERAHLRDMNDPTAMSLHGMALAEVLHRYQQGIVFCEEAVRRQGPSPFLLVNLAKAFLAARNKREAVRCLRRALARSSGEDDRARIELASLGLRRRPPIPFLPRSFFLNKLLGRMRHAFLERKTPADDGLRPIPAELGQLSGDLEAAREALTTAAREGGDQNR
jgi:tetratricopeptide (TPR) repeat protein